MRKGLGLERLPAKLSAPAGTTTLELWVRYQQPKAYAAHKQQSSTTVLGGTSHAASILSDPANLDCLTSQHSTKHGWSHIHRASAQADQTDSMLSKQRAASVEAAVAAETSQQNTDSVLKLLKNSGQGSHKVGIPDNATQNELPNHGLHTALPCCRFD